jgi:hypothetical protein
VNISVISKNIIILQRDCGDDENKTSIFIGTKNRYAQKIKLKSMKKPGLKMKEAFIPPYFSTMSMYLRFTQRI